MKEAVTILVFPFLFINCLAYLQSFISCVKFSHTENRMIAEKLSLRLPLFFSINKNIDSHLTSPALFMQASISYLSSIFSVSPPLGFLYDHIAKPKENSNGHLWV